MGHIEDVIVDNNYKNLELGKYIVKKLIKNGFNNNCYKIVLYCNNDNEKFYKNCNYINKKIEFCEYKT